MRFAIRSRFTMMVLCLAALAACTGMRAEAQVDPLWDHYKVYLLPPSSPIMPRDVFLQDQFGAYTHRVSEPGLYMNPTEKTVLDPPPQTYPISDPITHYAWWGLEPRQPFSGLVTAVNQFGDHTLNVFDGVYLLNPSLKNQGGAIPQRNHYKCYDCAGPPVNRQVRLTDQFGPWDALVTFPRWFCNPVAKQDEGGAFYPILDPNQHYVCYEYQPEDPAVYPATIRDQFLFTHSTQLGPSRYLCVPTYKSGVTDTKAGTWGKLKMLYR